MKKIKITVIFLLSIGLIAGCNQKSGEAKPENKQTAMEPAAQTEVHEEHKVIITP